LLFVASEIKIYGFPRLSCTPSNCQAASCQCGILCGDGGGGKGVNVSVLAKPWLAERRDPYVRISYLTTYGMMLLGVLASAVVCFFGYRDVPMITSKLCPVLDERWEGGDSALFGRNGRWLREVQLDGFGCAPALLVLTVCS
jgi:hypothetical protein